MNLALFFTRGLSLENWVETGLFDREKLIYEECLQRSSLEKVYWITYGSGDEVIADRLKSEGKLHKNIFVLKKNAIFKGKIGNLLYSFVAPFFYTDFVKKVDVLKTNQMDGGWSAVIASKVFRKPLFVRTGYTWSLLRKKQKVNCYKIRMIEFIERLTFKNASVAAVTSQSQLEYILENYPMIESKSKVIPNYIDTSIFKPDDSIKKNYDRIVFVGRLNKEKNLFNLIEAVKQTGLTLDIYGEGELAGRLKNEVSEKSAVNFLGTIPNHKLPRLLNGYNFFILPSRYECMPKSLLEAMACGLVCIGTNTEGIREIIDDNVNGYLADGTDKDSLIRAIFKATSNDNENIKLEAVKKIHSSFSLKAVAQKEIDAIRQIL